MGGLARAPSASAIDKLRQPSFWVVTAAFGIGLALGTLPRSGTTLVTDLVTLAGALIGAGASVAAALFVVDRTLHAEERAARQLLGDALSSFHTALRPFIDVTRAEIDARPFAGTKAALVAAHGEREKVTALLNYVLYGGSRLDARTWLNVAAIRWKLHREEALWAEEEHVIHHSRVSREVLGVHVDKLRPSAERLIADAERALRDLGREPLGSPGRGTG